MQAPDLQELGGSRLAAAKAWRAAGFVRNVISARAASTALTPVPGRLAHDGIEGEATAFATPKSCWHEALPLLLLPSLWNNPPALQTRIALRRRLRRIFRLLAAPTEMLARDVVFGRQFGVAALQRLVAVRAHGSSE